MGVFLVVHGVLVHGVLVHMYWYTYLGRSMYDSVCVCVCVCVVIFTIKETSVLVSLIFLTVF